MDSRTYWKKRETEQKKHNITEEADYNAEIERLYRNTMTAIQKEIDGFYGRYASKEGISIAEAKKRASKLDIEAYEEKAAQYVKEKNFSKQANEEMRLYNLTMKVNRLELLKANVGLELVGNTDQLQQFYEEKLTDRSIEQFERMAGILGKTVNDNAKTAHAIVNASFHNATWSQRIWTNQSMLKSELDRLLTNGIITGKNPRELARRLKKTFDVEKSKAERLMRTELARVRIASQEQSLKANGFDKYEFIALGDACGTCKGLDGKTFTLKQLKISGNAPPMHPNCRCAIAPATNDPEYEAWLDGFYKHGLSFEEWKKRNEAFNIPAFLSDIIETEKFDGDLVKYITNEITRIPEKHWRALNEYVKEVQIIKGADSCYNRNTRVLYLGQKAGDGDFIHECGHALETMLKLYEKPEYQAVRDSGLPKEINENSELVREEKRGKQFITYLENDKFLSTYQGFICEVDYKGESDFDAIGNLNKDALIEYFSEGYRYYCIDPKLLKSKDRALYDYIEGLL